MEPERKNFQQYGAVDAGTSAPENEYYAETTQITSARIFITVVLGMAILAAITWYQLGTVIYKM